MDLQKILADHAEWINNFRNGKCVNLRGANLRGVNLRGVNLRGANLDFSCWPLWCGSLGVKVDARIVNQLVYHLCSVDCADEDFQVVRPILLRLANKFHRVESGMCPALK